MSIRLENVSVTLPHESRPILHSTSLTINQSDITLLLGKTGSGKSTLLRTISGLTKPSTGSVYYGDAPLWCNQRLNPALLRKGGFVFQFPEHQLFASKVSGEFKYSLKPYRLTKAEVLARTVKYLEDFHMDGDLNANPLLMSTGQKRRIALASTFATQPEWLLLDEPSAGLDPLATRRFVEQIVRSNQHDKLGVILATHDLDTFLPICDRVLILENGHVQCVMERAELYQNLDVLNHCGIGLSDSLEIRLRLAKRGFPVAEGHPLTSSELASAIVNNFDVFRRDVEETKEASEQVFNCEFTSGEFVNSGQKRLLHGRDPRAKWLFYTALSFGMLLQTHVMGLTVATLGVILLLSMSKTPLRNIRRFSVPFLIFTVISVLVAGIQWNQRSNSGFHFLGIGFATNSALFTFISLFRIYLLILLSVWFTNATTPLQMKQGLAVALKPLAKLKMPVEPLALGTSLVLRFIPLISKEVGRFQLMARSRAKRAKKGIRLFDVPIFTIPLLLSLFRLGEDVALAMEARGYHSFRIKRSQSASLHMVWKDWALACSGLIALSVLLLLRYIS